MTVHVFRRDPRAKSYVNTTSHADGWGRGLSPFLLGPVKLYGRYEAKNVENAWQFCKVYPHHAGEDGEPNADYFRWAERGWGDRWAHRYPKGKNAVPKYSWWDGKRLNYVQARKRIYCPLYATAVAKTEAWRKLKAKYRAEGELWLWDFDAYDHRALGMSYRDVLCDLSRKMGHAFVLAMMLEGQREWEE